MPEKELANGGSGFWTNPDMWVLVGIFLMGFLARTLVSSSPFDKRRFAGEGILTGIGGVGLYAAGMLQGMSTLQMIMFGCLGALGGVRAVEWIIKAAMAIKKINIQ